ncbi:MAG: hypothetical protein ACERKV_11115 [Clostridiaceae bacterium]
MKIDILNLMNGILILVFIASFFSYIVYSYKYSIRKTNAMVKYLVNINCGYSQSMITQEYAAYEKYKIWIFCVHKKYKMMCLIR